MTVRSLLLLAIAGLYVLSIPWYRDAGSEVEIWFGLPDWVAVALVCYVGAAVLNAIAWLRTDVPDAEPGDAEPGNSGRDEAGRGGAAERPGGEGAP